jgi:hypothetical protein
MRYERAAQLRIRQANLYRSPSPPTSRPTNLSSRSRTQHPSTQTLDNHRAGLAMAPPTFDPNGRTGARDRRMRAHAALITIGNSPDGPVMLDLEACGLVTSQARRMSRGLARSAALELAVSPVADELDVIVVGCDPLVPPSGTLSRIQQLRTIDEALALIAGALQATGRALASEAVDHLLGSVRGGGSDPGRPRS